MSIARAVIARPDFSRGRGPCNFRQRDVTAAVRAVEAAGRKVRSVEFGPDGRFSVLVEGEAPPLDDLDAELKAFEAKHAS